MYTFPKKLKTISFVLMALGVLGMGYGFFSAPKTTHEVEQILAAEHSGHGDAHGDSSISHGAEKDNNGVHSTGSSSVSQHSVSSESLKSHGQDSHDENAHGDDEHKEHVEHVFHQLQNKPWAAVYTACIFFMFISLGVFTFNQIQYAASAGWSPVLFRVMEGLSVYLLPGSILFFCLLLASSFHLNHLFIWMDSDVVAHDTLIQGKVSYYNAPFFLIRAVIFLGGWNLFRYFSRKNSIALDDSGDLVYHKKNFKLSASYLVFFIVTESMMSWDWIMSIDIHWYSTLFGWYVLSSFLVSAVTIICMVTLYLKNNGYLEYVNTSHIHDLVKFMFGLSVFWTYLWFSQFMLQWYSDIPEEVTYYIFRIEEYNILFFGMLALNFVLPLLMLINTDFKRISWIILIGGVCILIGHYIDFYVMIMPGTVGASWFIGSTEIGSLLFFGGLFIFVTFSALTKAPLLAKNNPLLEESKHFHY